MISEDEVCSSSIIKEERITEQGSVSQVTLEPARIFVTELILVCDVLNHCACLSGSHFVPPIHLTVYHI